MTKNFSNFFAMNLAVKNFFLVGFFDQNFFYNEFGCKNFFQHISKNGLRMAVRGLVKAVEKFFFLTTSTFQK